jgi:uncharacterized membrane protein
MGAVAILGLSGFGMYLGRFARFNSWDLLTQPGTLMHNVRGAVDPTYDRRAMAVTALFSSFLLVTYATVELLGRIGPTASGGTEVRR